MTTHRFPFGEPLAPVPHTGNGHTRIFILGAYSSALHAMWKYGPGPSDRVQALAIANEPRPFWDGSDDIASIARHTPPFGELLPTPQNGPSGKVLRMRYLIPLGIHADRCWITDVVNTYFSNAQQMAAFRRAFAFKNTKAPAWRLPLRPTRITPDAKRAKALESELREAAPAWLITLGDEPLAALGLGTLSRYDYGQPTRVRPFGIDTMVIPFTHPRNAGRLGNHSTKWASTHDTWLRSESQRLRRRFTDA